MKNLFHALVGEAWQLSKNVDKFNNQSQLKRYSEKGRLHFCEIWLIACPYR
jgi:hypothetical protein